MVKLRESETMQARHLTAEVEWFVEVLNNRFESYFKQDNNSSAQRLIMAPPALKGKSHYADFVENHKLKGPERVVLVLALLPHLQPQVLDVFFTRNPVYERGYTEFGGIKGSTFSGFIPTGETALFLLAGNDVNAKLHYMHFFNEEHVFARQNILRLEASAANEPYLSGSLAITEDTLEHAVLGEARTPGFSSAFPAKEVTTQLNWSDLVLEPNTQEQINEILAWMEFGDTIMEEWGLGKKLKPGYKSLFFGSPGTGKTLTATLIGKTVNRKVFRIDLSMIVSKYIGETEKNLAKIFDRAANKDWILFFDEADALFGKRTNVSDSHDRYANQEVSYLLQKIEEHNGLVILATNLKSNIDDAFIRRFQSIIHFRVPRPAERLLLWEQAFSKKSKLEKKISLKQIAERYELSGGSIINVVQYASLMALSNGTKEIKDKWIISGIRKEFLKEGKTI